MLIPLHDDNPVKRLPVLTIGIIILNVAIHLYGAVQTKYTQRQAAARFGFVPQLLTNLDNGKSVELDLVPEEDFKDEIPADQRPIIPPGKPRKIELEPTLARVALTLVTSIFMHGDWLHLGGNMLFLWVFGNNIEDRLGRVIFLLFYLIGGVVASLCHWGMTTGEMASIPVVGASGAVAVMLGAYAVAYPKAKVLVLLWICIPLIFRIPAMILLGIWVGFEIMNAFLEDQGFATDVALWAHIGGFFIGVVCMPLLAAGTQEPGEDWDKEAQQQFDYDHVEPDVRHTSQITPKQEPGIWWEDEKTTRDQPPAKPNIWWE